MATGKLKTGKRNPVALTMKTLRISMREKVRDHSKTEGIEAAEVEIRKAAGECLRCAWPADRKGTHRVKDCVRLIKLDNGSAGYPKTTMYLQLSVETQDSGQDISEEDSSN
jgi:hypothetical protein